MAQTMNDYYHHDFYLEMIRPEGKRPYLHPDLPCFLSQTACHTLFLAMRVSFDSHVRIWFEGFVDRRLGVSRMFGAFVNLDSFLCRNAW
jgi:hypothetical protein